MTVAAVQNKSGTNSLAAQALTLDSAPTAGNILIASLWRRRFGSVTPGTGWNLVSDGINMNPSASQQSALLWKLVPSSDPAAQSIGTWSGTPAESRITVAEFSGVDQLDQTYLSKINLQSSATGQSLGAFTPTSGVEALIIEMWHGLNGVTYSMASGSDTIVAQGLCDTAAAPTGLMAYRVVSPASGSYTIQANANTATEWGGLLASFTASVQTAAPGLINQTATPFAPVVNRQGDLVMPLLSQAATASSPIVNQLAGTNRVRHKTVNPLSSEDYTGRTRPIEWNQAHTDDQGHEIGPGLQYGWAPLDSGLLIPASYLPDSDPIVTLFGTPDTAFEFNSSSLTGLTAMGSADTEDANTTFAGHLYLKDNDSTLVGRYAAVTPPFTIIAKLTDAVMSSNYKYAHVFVGVGTPGKLVSIGPVYSDGQFVNGRVWTSPGDGSPTVITPTTTPVFGPSFAPWYLGVSVTSSTNASYYVSRNGRIWFLISASRNDSLTIASAGVAVGAYTSDPVQAAWDYIRIWNSAKTFPAFT